MAPTNPLFSHPCRTAQESLFVLVSFPVAEREHSDESNPKEEGLILDHRAMVGLESRSLKPLGKSHRGQEQSKKSRSVPFLCVSSKVPVRQWLQGVFPRQQQQTGLPGDSRIYRVDSHNSLLYFSGQSPLSKLSKRLGLGRARVEGVVEGPCPLRP